MDVTHAIVSIGNKTFYNPSTRLIASTPYRRRLGWAAGAGAAGAPRVTFGDAGHVVNLTFSLGGDKWE